MKSWISSTRLVLILGLTFCLIGCGSDSENKPAESAKSNIPPPATANERDSIFYGMTADDSTTVFDLTVKFNMVEYDRSGSDYFVYSINRVEQGNDYFWVYAVNDSMGQVASNKRQIGPGDRVVWHYRLITR
ncbi:MAG TPA: DUF4430 domain-containing protein [candidate division Zixibacteria bacterium]|nr:DUF4430 domain-containing protein [candidate division Zixibacteria bacterium]